MLICMECLRLEKLKVKQQTLKDVLKKIESFNSWKDLMEYKEEIEKELEELRRIK